jgi:hypothetical protein
MAELSAIAISIIVAAGITALGLAIWALFFAAWGAIFLFRAAREAGGVALVVYFVVWITSVPIMLIICIVMGLAQKAGRLEEKRWAEKNRDRNSN